MLKNNDIDWLRIAFNNANRYSQDANSQVGAIIVDPETNTLISFGANRMHYGLEKRFEGRGEREILGKPEKYTDLIHAERDAICVAKRKRISLIGKTMYATWTPCIRCAELILKNGIKRFVTHASTYKWYNEARRDIKDRNDWADAIEKAISLLKKGKVAYEAITEPIGEVKFLFDDILRHP